MESNKAQERFGSKLETHDNEYGKNRDSKAYEEIKRPGGFTLMFWQYDTGLVSLAVVSVLFSLWCFSWLLAFFWVCFSGSFHPF